nr:GIGANTEA-like protein [Oncidium hybrid cultivar]
MSASCQKWIDGLQFSSLLWPPPPDEQQRQAQILAYVEYFAQFTSEQFPEDIAQLIQRHYPVNEKRLLDDVLAIFVLHHPEHGHAIVHPILSCIIDGTLVYGKNDPPFNSFISLISQTTEKEYSEQWALACGEILRVLTLYNRPIYKSEHHIVEAERSSSGSCATTSDSSEGESSNSPDRKTLRPLTPWITDILLSAPLGIRSDYFRWCGGVMGKYAAAGELKPPTTACSRRSGKHPQLMTSTPRWAVANGAGVILSVCDDEVARYETANLTAAAVPALLLPPPTTPLDEHLVAGLPALEPYARLFHRYYSIATPSATQRLLLGLLEAPPSWAPDALDAAVQLVELLRAAEDYESGMRLPRNWMHLHFLRAIGTAMSMREGIAADAAATLLFRILSQPTLLFPPLRQTEGVEVQHEPLAGYISSYKRQLEFPSAEASIEATAQGIASMLCAHGPDVEWRICTIWEAAYGLLPLSSSAVDLPEIVVAAPLQPPVLSWSLYLPLLKVLEYLPRGSPSEACLMRIFVAVVEAILLRTFPQNASIEQSKNFKNHCGMSSNTKNLAVAEIRTMIHSLFLESCASEDLASRLLFVVLTVCISHDALPNGNKRPTGSTTVSSGGFTDQPEILDFNKSGSSRKRRKQGPAATFDSYVLAAICALSCELQLLPLISKNGFHLDSEHPVRLAKAAKTNGSSHKVHNGMSSAVQHTRRFLKILEALFSLKPSSVGTSWGYSSNEIVAAAMVAAHVSELFGRSKACINSLSVLMRCKWDSEIYARASSLYHLVDLHGKTVASIVDKAEPLEAQLVLVPLKKDISLCSISEHALSSSSTVSLKPEDNGSMESKDSSIAPINYDEAKLINSTAVETSEKSMERCSQDASDIANFLTMDLNGRFNCNSQALLRSVLAEKQELCFSVVSLLWHKLISAPETKMSAESTSAQQGWRQVVDALCDVVSASPTKASAAIVLQAERDLQPWIARDDEQGQRMWRINQRIVKLIVELMRSQGSPETLIILASASDLLLRATDGMLVDGEACTLPQLELLEMTARAIHLVANWGETGLAVADGLTNLLKCRLSATVRCLSHPSALVRALSISVLRDIMHPSPIKSSNYANRERLHLYDSHYITNWHSDIENCIKWEARSRQATGMALSFLGSVSKELGFRIPS